MRPEAIQKMFAKRIEKIMRKIRKVVVDAGFYCDDVCFRDADYYSWSFVCHTQGEPTTNDLDNNLDLDFEFIITESEYWDGSEGGVSFKLNINSIGGEILGGLTPFNYSDDVWVKRSDRAAIRERFRIMEDAGTTEIPAIVQNHIDDVKKRKRA